MSLAPPAPDHEPKDDVREDARAPEEISLRGWGAVLLAAVKAGMSHRVPSVAAAASFYGLLAFVPAVAAFGAAFGLFAGPDALQRQLEAYADLVPAGPLQLLQRLAVRFAHGDADHLAKTALLLSATSVAAASSAVRALMQGLNTAYRTREQRHWLRRRTLSIVFAAGCAAAVAADVALMLKSGDYAARETTVFWPTVRLLLRWASLFAISVGALSLLYRYGPDRRRARWRWVTPGSMIAAAVGLFASASTSLYLAQFAQYERSYGGLGSVLGLVVWMWVSMIVLLGGAELNFALECRTSAVTDVSGRPTPRPAAAPAPVAGQEA